MRTKQPVKTNKTNTEYFVLTENIKTKNETNEIKILFNHMKSNIRVLHYKKKQKQH